MYWGILDQILVWSKPTHGKDKEGSKDYIVVNSLIWSNSFIKDMRIIYNIQNKSYLI